MKIRTINTVPIPITIFMAACSMFSPNVYSGTKETLVIAPSLSVVIPKSISLFSKTA